VAATPFGGIGAMHELCRRVGLDQAINANLDVLKKRPCYHESDHVLNIAFNAMCGGANLEHLELLRTDESYLDALGTERIPDPTTAGDFCRRLDQDDLDALMDSVNQVRSQVWAQQPDSFFDEAVIEADGTIVGTTGECKEGMDLSYKNIWGYHPLLISLANTQESMFIVNRSGNRNSHVGAAEYYDKAIRLCREGGFRKITLRGDTAFTQTAFLDGWHNDKVQFIFGMPAIRPMVARARNLPETRWKRLHRRKKYEVATTPRSRPENVKEQIVTDRGYKDVHLEYEDVAEFRHQPSRCQATYRIVIVRKNLRWMKGQEEFWPEIRYLFYITNDTRSPPEEIVFSANKRCNQENLIDQLKNGVPALRAPLNTLHANGAYMVMASLAWNLKQWFALLMPVSNRWRKHHEREKADVLRMEMRTFINAMIRLPCQVVRSGRRTIYRLLSWSPWLRPFLRAADAMRHPLRC